MVALCRRQKIMKRILLLLATLAAASTFATACAVESSTTVLSPTTPDAPATPLPSAPTTVTWQSETFALPSPGSCGNFQWQVTNATPNSMSGNFSGTCAGNIAFTGSASGTLVGKTVPLTVTGVATYAGVITCPFDLSGTGVIEDNDTLLTIPYSGTTCFGPVSGTQRLHKPVKDEPPPAVPAPLPDPPAPPGDVLFGCGGIPDHQLLVNCIWDHIRPTDGYSAFEVTKRVAWALRGEGAGLLIKNGGENIIGWRGYSFSMGRIVYPDGRLVKVIYAVGPASENGPSWQDNGDYVDPVFYLPAIDPSLP
jgi:hypothetical protein